MTQSLNKDQNHAMTKPMTLRHPSSTSSVNAEGTRLRLRLSNTSIWKLSESGFFRRCPSGAGTPGNSQRNSCQSRESSGADGSHPRCAGMGYSSHSIKSLSSRARARNILRQVVAGILVSGNVRPSDRSNASTS